MICFGYREVQNSDFSILPPLFLLPILPLPPPHPSSPSLHKGYPEDCGCPSDDGLHAGRSSCTSTGTGRLLAWGGGGREVVGWHGEEVGWHGEEAGWHGEEVGRQ